MKFFLFILLFPFSLIAENIPRHVLAFWDSSIDKAVENSLIHRTLEMPLNYLGLDVIYADTQKNLPDIAGRTDICGIIICFREGTSMEDPKAFIEWTINAIDQGKKVILMQNPGFLADKHGNYTSGDLQNRLYEKIGFTNTQEWINYPFNYHVINTNKELLPFEKELPYQLPGFYVTKVFAGKAKSYLKVGIPGKPNSEADLMVIGPNGAYISEFYANTFDDLLFQTSPRSLGWYINPFRFFELALDLPMRPIPDITTLAGRRIYIATCHGDSFNIDTKIEGFQNKSVAASKILLEKVIKPNPDLPIAMGIVAADIDPKWVAKKDSQAIAKEYLSLPQVEAASHTYSHPFYWGFFETGGPEKEVDYLYLYPYGSWQSSYLSWMRAKFYQTFTPKEFAKRRLKWGYTIPRAYANQPFDLEKEITGAVDYINQFAPPQNKVKLLIWSGDSLPWDAPVEMAYKAGLKNYGGGFNRFDPDYPSNLFVYPIGRKPGGLIQIYASANADNDYTSNWRDNFYGFKYLPATLKNTDIPRRLKPIQLYYHSYSGEFQASVDAILSNIAYIRTQSFIPIFIERFCTIGAGFYSAEIKPLGSGKWSISNREGLQTFRFDKAEGFQPDLTESSGVIGWNDHQGSLYVYLDAFEKEPVIALKSGKQVNNPLYLIDSSWEIGNLKREEGALSFNTKGWGKLEMRWKAPANGRYSVEADAKPQNEFQTDNDNIVHFELDLPYNSSIIVKIKQLK